MDIFYSLLSMEKDVVLCNLMNMDAIKMCHTLNAYIFETNNLIVVNNISLDSI